MEQRAGLPGAAHDDLIQMAQHVEQRGDLYGALDLYRRAAELAPPGSELAQHLLDRAAGVEARLVAAQAPGPGRATVTGSLPTPVRKQQGGGLRWLLILLGCLVIAGIVAVGGSRIWPQGRDSAGAEPTPQPTPAAVLVAPPANAPPTSTAPVRPDPTGLLGAADDARRAGDFQRAMDILQGLKAMMPPPDGIDDRLYQTHVAYGQNLLERGEHDASLAQFDAALAIRPDGREAQDGRTPVQQVRNWDRMEAQWDKDPEAALAAAEESFKLDPEWRGIRQKLYALLIGRAERQWGRGERDAARATLERAKTIDSNAGDADDRMQRWFAPPPPGLLIGPTLQAPGP
jgi:tetratricopeptide (TPR) repeat protein